MKLQGQVGCAEGGYAMAAMLVTLAIMSVMLSVAMPAWRQMVQREREEELIFRGQQYARAIGLFQRRYAAAYPPDVETLVKQKFLRKKYADPMVPDGEFQVLYQGMGQPGMQGQPGMGQPGMQAQPGMQGRPGMQGQQVARQSGGTTQQQQPPRGLPGAAPGGRAGSRFGTVGPRGGVIGVASKSTATSIRLYNGRNHYNEWQFIYAPALFGPGQQRPGMRPGMRPGAQPGMRPGQRGMPVPQRPQQQGQPRGFDPRNPG